VKKIKEIAVVFLIGAIIYPTLETLWRGYTHWTMSLTAGLCFSLAYVLFTKLKYKALPLWKKCIFGAAIITSIEFVVGCIVNLALHWNVWNYSSQPGNILGQICPLYFAIWLILCLPIIYISKFLNSRLHI
jgi:uncharacterized membrane protein